MMIVIEGLQPNTEIFKNVLSLKVQSCSLKKSQAFDGLYYNLQQANSKKLLNVHKCITSDKNRIE